MKYRFAFLLITFIFSSTVLWGQDMFDLINPEHQAAQRCIRCYNAFRLKPKEVQFKIERDDKHNLYFVVNNQAWFYQVFTSQNDGIAIDIVPRRRYDCDLEQPKTNGIIRGTLQQPVYAKRLLDGLYTTDGMVYQVKIGKIPLELQDQEVEFNIIFINDKNICRYNSLYNLKSYPLELLDMGVYLDTIIYQKEFKNALIGNKKYVLKYKTLNFKIPFEQNKAVYSMEDIKPLYDSLRLTNFNIKKIDIKAYSSVEGTLKRNIQLQEERARSIVKALQDFQEPMIITKIKASENWVEFLNDIAPTSYAYLDTLTKAQIKHKLNVEGIHRELEPYLKNHRKALVTMELQRKDVYTNYTPQKLQELYDKAVANSDALEAGYLQNALFEKLKEEQISPEQFFGLKVPKQKAFAPLRSKKSAIKYLIDDRESYISFLEMQRLLRLLPNDKKIRYNYCALKFKVWRYVAEPVNPQMFLKEIKSLEPLGIPKALIDRMLINYHIIKSELYMQKSDFYGKDRSVKFIYDNFRKLSLDDAEALNLAQYFTWYANTDYTLEVLQEKVKKIAVTEDLLFYYLNHTLVDQKLTSLPDYRTIMLNAITSNRKRFCKLFDTHGKGGVTFQLLEDEYLRKTYCENCTEYDASHKGSK